MKILTISGTRPELIRLSIILDKLDKVCNHCHVYTNQNFDPNLSTIFLEDLGIRKPDYTLPPAPQTDKYYEGTDGKPVELKKSSNIGSFLGHGFIEFDRILDIEKPDKVLVLGDTNSGLLALLAAKRGIPIYHLEAGNRCYDNAVPEETNRGVIDAFSLFNLPYTENSKTNLINEGFHKSFVFKTGNPIWEVLCHYGEQINKSNILHKLGLIPDNKDARYPYVLLSFHRTENVDTKSIAKSVVDAINKIAEDYTVVYPFHPRSKDQFKKHGLKFHSNVMCIDPIGFFDFVKLEQYATAVITDSGTVPEETSLFGVPCIVLRNTTERQELMENGSLILAGTNTKDILYAFNGIGKTTQKWGPLDDYTKLNVSDTVIRILMGQRVSIKRKGHDEY